MEFINNSLIICPSIIKKHLLKEIENSTELTDVSFISIEEITKKLTFSYSKKTIYYMMKKYNIKYEIALIFLKNLYYINNSNSFLSELKKDLEENNLLIKDDLYTMYLKNKKIFVYGYDFITKFQLKLLEPFHPKIVKKSRIDKKYNVYEFNTIEEEIRFVLNQICELIDKGVDINKIKLVGVSKDYEYLLLQLFEMYNIPINLNRKTPIFYTSLVNRFLLLLDSDINITLEKLNEEFKNIDTDIYNKIVNVLNDYNWCSNYLVIKECLVYEFKHTYKDNTLYLNAVEVVDINNNIFNDDEYVFLLGFNQDYFPVIHKDEDYLTDEEKLLIGIEDSNQLNKLEKGRIINNISRIKNLTISYKLKSAFNEYYPSLLVKELEMNVIKYNEINYKYSNKDNILILSKKIDEFLKFGVINKETEVLFSTYPNIKYLEYDNNFTGINKEKLYNYLNNELQLSYTAIDKYYKCGFMYYLSNILKIDIFEESFPMFIGSLFHYVLSFAFYNDFDFETIFNKFINETKRNLNAKESFLLEKLKVELEFIIETIKNQYQSIGYDGLLCEEKVTINKEKNIKVSFVGVIDKIMYKQVYDESINDDVTYIALIDYKTGNIDTKMNNIEYGLNIQLPIYLYLARNTNKLKNVRVYGFYFQKILLNEAKVDHKKDFKEIKVGELKLQGYSLANCDPAYEFDLDIKEHQSSRVIKGLRIKNDGTYYNSAKVLTNEQINLIYELAENKIDEAIDKITNGEFYINPKHVDKENISCKYCKFQDVCFMKNKDLVYLKSKTIVGEEDEN